MEDLKPNQHFQVEEIAPLNQKELEALTLLYQTIADPKSISLYLTLSTLAAKVPLKHDLLVQILNISVKDFLSLRHILEALGLLEVYGELNQLNYVLNRPLDAFNFFNDAILSAFLYLKIGEREFIKLKKLLVVERSLKKGERLTKKFTDVYDIMSLKRVNFVPEVNLGFKDKNERQAVEIEPSIDVELMQAAVIHKGLNSQILTPQLLLILNELAYLYKFDIHELAHLLYESMTPDDVVEIGGLRSRASKQFQLLNAGKKVTVFNKLDNISSENDKKIGAFEEEDGLIAFFNQNPVDFLRFKSKGKPPLPADIKLIERLKIDHSLPPGVINVLIEYVLDYTGGSLPTTLVEKIAGEWQRSDIKTARQAMDRVSEVLTKSSEYKKGTNKPSTAYHVKKKVIRSEPIPDWFGVEPITGDASQEEEAKKSFEAIKREMFERNR